MSLQKVSHPASAAVSHLLQGLFLYYVFSCSNWPFELLNLIDYWYRFANIYMLMHIIWFVDTDICEHKCDIDTDMFDTLFVFLHLLYICYILLCSVSFPPPEDEILCFTFQINHDYIAAVCNKLNGHRKAHQARHTFNTKVNNSFCWPFIMRHGGDWHEPILYELQWT